MPKANVTVYIEVFNEEARIEACLKNFTWAKELIVFVKDSTDRTFEIASKYATKVIRTPFCEGSENIPSFSPHMTCDWTLSITAASLIHPALVAELTKLTNDPNFNYDVIGIPYGMYAFGVRSRQSPWTTLRKNTLIRRSVLRLSDDLHREITFSPEARIYEMPLLQEEQVFYHLTHRDGDDFFRKHMRYTKYEAQQALEQMGKIKALEYSFYEIFKAVGIVLLRRRSFLLGWDGWALGTAYVSYFMMKFIYIWDLSRANGTVVYPELRQKITALWDEKKS